MTSYGGARSVAPAWLVAAATAASLAGAILPWWSSGPGSAIGPLKLSAVLLAGQFTPLVPRLVGAALLLPLLAVALLFISLGLPRGVQPVRACAFGCLAAVGAALLAAPNRGSLGAGGLAVLVGAGLNLAALLVKHSPAPVCRDALPPS